MAFKFPDANQKAFSGRENQSSGKPKGAMNLQRGVKDVARALSPGAPGSPNGFRPGGYGPGYNQVGGKSGMQVRIPNVRDQSNVHSCKGVNPENILTGGPVKADKNILGPHSEVDETK